VAGSVGAASAGSAMAAGSAGVAGSAAAGLLAVLARPRRVEWRRALCPWGAAAPWAPCVAFVRSVSSEEPPGAVGSNVVWLMGILSLLL